MPLSHFLLIILVLTLALISYYMLAILLCICIIMLLLYFPGDVTVLFSIALIPQACQLCHSEEQM